MKNYRSELVGLFGCPVDENPTVIIIEADFKALGLNYRYNTTLVKPEDLGDAIKALKAFNMKGKRVVILGAGGAARSISVELANQCVEQITVVNRDQARGQSLVTMLKERTNVDVDFVLWNQRYDIPQDTDILVNASSIGLYPNKNKTNINYKSLSNDMLVCDIIPNPPQTPFLDEAEKAGCKTFDGFSMLVNQAAISFKFWTEQEPPIDIMREALAIEFGFKL